LLPISSFSNSTPSQHTGRKTQVLDTSREEEQGERKEKASLWYMVWFPTVDLGIHISGCLLLTVCHQPHHHLWGELGQKQTEVRRMKKRTGKAERGEKEKM
jgi:hypothetical protein